MRTLSNSRVVKIGIVTPDAEQTAARFRAIFPAGPAPASQTEDHPPFTVEPYTEYRGRRVPGRVKLKVQHVYTENFWFEIIEPVGDEPNPWRDHLEKHGTSVCFTSIYVESGFDDELATLAALGYSTTWVEDKGFERYAYVDTTADLGLLLEVKERLAK